jgi:hypothetical protein
VRFLALCTCFAILAGCADDETAATTGGCVDYAAVSGTPSFANDLMPIMQRSCNLSNACHTNRTMNPAGEELQLGPPLTEMMMTVVPTQMEIDAAHARIVDDGTAARSTSPLVVPGDPAASWLMQKLEYCGETQMGGSGPCAPKFSTCSAVQCSAKGCGVSMPQLSPQLPQSERDLFAAWIKAGAPNN